MSLDLCLLAYGASFDIIFNPFLHSNPPVVLLNFSKCFVPSWMSGCRGVMHFAYYCSLYFFHVWDNDLSFWGVEDTDLLG